MADLIVSSTPPASLAELCARETLFFHGSGWLNLLEKSFGVTTDYIWDQAENCGGAVSSFRAGPFRLGYLGFPVGGLVGGQSLGAAMIDRWCSQRAELTPVAIRIPVSAFAGGQELDLDHDATPESAIVDLPSWSLDDVSGNHRRDVQKAERSDMEVIDATDDDAAAVIHAIYQETVARHRGGLRYNSAYFRNLVALVRESSEARVMLAMLDGNIAGFTVVVRQREVAYYLHGGIRLEYRRHQPSALLLHRAIRWAQEQGCQCFNLMSSPPDQESLVWYKEKWGAVTREHRTYTLPLRSSWRLLRVAERLYRRLR